MLVWPSVTVRVGTTDAAQLNRPSVFAMRDCLRRFERPPRRRGTAAGARDWSVWPGAGGDRLLAADAGRRRPHRQSLRRRRRDAAGCIPPGLLDDLVGYWRFDDGAGSATARDGSGRGNNGALIGLNAARRWVPGWSGAGVEFGGAGWIEVPPSASIDAIADRLTIAAWVYLEGTSSTGPRRRRARSAAPSSSTTTSRSTPTDRPSLFVTTATSAVLLTAPDVVVAAHLDASGGNLRRHVRAALRQRHDGHQSVASPARFAADTTPLVLGGNVQRRTRASRPSCFRESSTRS